MTVSSYEVKGMTCGHCVQAVTQEVSKVPGVSEVSVDLDQGRVTVTSAAPISETSVREAVDEAGYELVGTVG